MQPRASAASGRGAAPASGASQITVGPRAHGPAVVLEERADLAQQLERRRPPCSSVSGKCWPMSPSPAAPSSASMIACVSTSASEWPASPRSASSISTPPRISGRALLEPVRVEADARRGRSSERLQPALAALEHRELASRRPRRATRAPVVAVAEVLGQVRVRGQRDRPPGLEAHLEERPARGRSRRPACAGRPSRPRSPRRTRRCRPSPDRRSAAGRPPGAALSPQTFTRSGWARMSNMPVRAASPSVSK